MESLKVPFFSLIAHKNIFHYGQFHGYSRYIFQVLGLLFMP